MKKITLLLICSFFTFSIAAQDSNQDSYTIQRLIIYNQKGEILLEKHQNGWMTPALRHQSKESINQGLSNLAAEFGLKVSPPKLAGIFLFIAEYKPQSSFRQHYFAHVVEGEIKLPEDKLDVQWFSPHKAVEMMSMPDAKLIPAVRDMTQHLLEFPEIVWGGSFSLWKENGKTQYKVIENFYPLTGK